MENSSQQIVEAKIRGFICLNAHPKGCFERVRQHVSKILESCPGSGIGTALVIGSSTGYGLDSLLTACFGYGAKTLGVCLERPAAGKKTASAGWYNMAAAELLAKEQGKQLETIVGDAFSHEIKQRTLGAIRERFEKIDLVIYSVAAPKRKDPDSEKIWSSTLKPCGAPFSSKTVNLRSEAIEAVEILPATEEEVFSTVKVMGGEDWELWIQTLKEAEMLAEDFRTIAYSYVGPELTFPIYRQGTIGRAKEDLEKTAKILPNRYGGAAWVSVNKALVTQASAAIPVVPLYMSILFRTMKARGSHEGSLEQCIRLFNTHIAPEKTPIVDSEGRIRMDDWEMAAEVQGEIKDLWQQVDSHNFQELADFTEFRSAFRRLFGFDISGVDYSQPVQTEVPLTPHGVT